MKLSLTLLPHRYSIVRLCASDPTPDWASHGSRPDGLTSITRLGDELSIVCPTAQVPTNVATRSDDWRALRLDGPFELALTGILASVLTPLAQAEISVFALATFDTDVVLVREAQLDLVIHAMRRTGHTVG